jgi:hypothetical protein
MKRITIPLQTPLKGHHGPISEVIIREPNVYECLELGDPYVVGSSPSGAQLVVENPEVITAYARRLVVEPKDTQLLSQGGVELARAIKEAVISFFLLGTDTDAVSETLPTSSRSEASAPASAISAE